MNGTDCKFFVGQVVHRLGARGGDAFEIYDYPGEYAQRFDGVDKLSHEDETFTHAGRIGLWTKADASTSFDDLEIVPLGK